MKSIREWMKEKGIVSEAEDSLNPNYFAKIMGGQTFKVDTDLRAKFRSKVNDILNDEEFKGKSKLENLREFMAVISALISDMEGTTGSVRKLAGAMNDPSDQIAQEVK